MSYVELQVATNFSFLRGASHHEELVRKAAKCGYSAIAITDRNSVAGIVRAYAAAQEHGVRVIVGARLAFDDGPEILCLPSDRAAYGRLTSLLTIGKRRVGKGECLLHLDDLIAHAEGQNLVVLPPDQLNSEFAAVLRRLKEILGPLYLAAHRLYGADDAARLTELGQLADLLSIGLVATNDVHYHDKDRCELQDVLTCVRERATLQTIGTRLFPNAERHLKPPVEMAALFQTRPDAVANTLRIAASCRFSLKELEYEYPIEEGSEGRTSQEELAHRTWLGAADRYPEGVPEKVTAQLKHELALIATLKYAAYFLTVHHIVRFARSRDILCQGRGSAANSAVCYCLRITDVSPGEIGLLFERFVSGARGEPPDIDVDFEHQRREEVIQYIYKHYGREKAGIAATVISYRPRSAIRDFGKVFGLSEDTIVALNRLLWRDRGGGQFEEYCRAAGLDPDDRTLRRILNMAVEANGFPRHLSQHVGGFVITRGPLHELVPIENAAMDDRTFIEWDKDDLDTLKILKVDVLALGMLSCIRKSFDLLRQHHGRDLGMATLPREDPAVYDMLCKADAVGVFQVESRAQMSMLPRLQPREFYDLVVEVAIVRPGPIQGDMVHPYLRRRSGKEKVDYPSPELKEVLSKTYGVPLFQEQAMKIAIVAAGFSPEEADKLRRAMATFRRAGTIREYRDKFIRGMVGNNYTRDFAERCFKQIEGFSEYGFPESHAASFAKLVYVSAWLKRYYPAAFAAAMLNSLPMGFYEPAQLIRDARDHGVDIRPVDINHSDWDNTLEAANGDRASLRLGLRQVNGFSEADAIRLMRARACTPFGDLRDVWRRAGLNDRALDLLAGADAWGSLGLDRRQALWRAKSLGGPPLPLFAHAEMTARRGDNAPAAETAHEPAVILPEMTLSQHVMADYRYVGLSLKQHPMALVRAYFDRLNCAPHAQLADLRDGARVAVAGLVLIRQQPGTASGVIFVTLEDETGIANLVVWPSVFERYRRPLLDSKIMVAAGRLQKEGLVLHLIADHLADHSYALGAEIEALSAGRNFH